MKNLNYGIIGNCRSAALIDQRGSLDWCCLPEFDSPSIFARLLDQDKGGHFQFIVANDYKVEQQYVENTCLLKTVFSGNDGVFEVYDFLPRYLKKNDSHHTPPEIIRFIRLVSGEPEIRVDYQPQLEYARGETFQYVKKDFIVNLTEGDNFDTLFLYTNAPKDKVAQGTKMKLTEDLFFLITYNEKIVKPDVDSVYLEMERTKVYWLNWVKETPNFDLYGQVIKRSALTLKMLSYDKTGAVLAAATTSLPETIGEVRNWDYRFCWIRDASMVIKVATLLGHNEMAQRFMKFILDLIPDKDEKLQIMYGINKEKVLTETFLSHLSGYENSSPVRIGNAAYLQRQNDIYGILMDVVHQQVSRFSTDVENCEELWTLTKGIAWVVSKHWREPDKGIWEFRTENRHFTFSKVLCWVAIDKAIKISEQFGKTSKLERWRKLRKEIKSEIHEKAWNDEVSAFTQSYESTALDASVLLMENYGFIDAKDPRYVQTVKAIGNELSKDGLLYRYKNKDDFGEPSSSFTICTFWYINSLFKIGEEKEAKRHFEEMLTYANHLGLFSEDIDFKTKRLLGNFPQAYSHLALIETAINIADSDSEKTFVDQIDH
jgi:GH15 family glucan-1,4-alpha-glucosidase